MKFALAFSLLATPALSATLTVTTTDDENNVDGDCSLREAIAGSDACGARTGADDVVALPGNAVITLTSDLTIAAPVTLRGDGSRINVGAARVIAEADTSLERLVLADGTGPALVVRNSAVTLTRVTILNNDGGGVVLEFTAGNRPRLTATDSLWQGNTGGPALRSFAGSLSLLRSSFVDNDGDDNGGAVAAGGGGADEVRVRRCTFSNNSTTGSGGALALFVPAEIQNSTFVDNTADVSGGAVFAFVNPLIGGSIFQGNSSTCAQQTAGNVSTGGNFADDLTGCQFAGGDQQGFTQLTALGDFGGVTPTHFLIGGLGLDGAGFCSNLDNRDQRNATILIGEACDAGAVEHDGLFLDVALRSEVVAPGEECARGGTRLLTGLDDGGGIDVNRTAAAGAGNGALEDAEVDASVLVCSDESAATLVDVQNDATCAAGGIVVHSGGDDDGDGVLDTAERDRSDRICNGEDGADGNDGADGANGVDGAEGPRGPPGADGEDGADGATGATGANGGAGFSSLLRLSEITAGDDGCTAGGQKVESGLDDGAGGAVAGDGVLDDGEVDDTAILCNGEAFEDEFETSGGPTCAASAIPIPLVLLLLSLHRSFHERRRRQRG